MLAIAAGFVIAAHAAQAEPLKIRISWVTSPGSGVTLMMMKPDLSIHQGISYTLDATHFASTAVGSPPSPPISSISPASLIRPSARRSRMRISTI